LSFVLHTLLSLAKRMGDAPAKSYSVRFAAETRRVRIAGDMGGSLRQKRRE